MDIPKSVEIVLASAGLLVAALAWVAKIRWSREFTSLKEAQLNSKEEQIKTLKEQLTFYQNIAPSKVVEQLKSMKELFENLESDYEDRITASKFEINDLRKQLRELSGKESEATSLLEIHESKLSHLERELNFLRSEKDKLTLQLSDFRNSPEFKELETQMIAAASSVKQFSRMMNSSKVAIIPAQRGDKESILNFISKGSHGGMISEEKLRKALKPLSEGSYIFFFASRKPKRFKKTEIEGLTAFFGVRSWKTNMWRIRPAEDIVQIQRFVPHYVICFRFDI